MDAGLLKRFDVDGMHKIYDAWPQMAAECYGSDLPSVHFDEISHMVFAGMGGSGTVGDVFSAVLSKTAVHVDVVKGYQLPKTSGPNSLVIATSISGNTEETLYALTEAAKQECHTVAFSNGGVMEEFCRREGITHTMIPTTHSSRASFPTFMFSILAVIESMLPIQKSDITDSLQNMQELGSQISSSVLSEDNPAVSLAGWLSYIPIIYYPWGLQAAAIRFKNSLQENAKTHTITEDVIEACHNGIVSWCHKTDVKPVLIRGADDHPKTKERWTILKEFFAEKGIEYREVHSSDGSILEKLVHLIYLLDYSSLYKAVLSGTDPTPVEPIDFVKRRLAQKRGHIT